MLSFFTNDLRRNLIKILCLTVGLALGFLLIAKVYVEETFDSCYPDSDRLFLITESITQEGEFKEFNQTPGATAPGLHRYSPYVECAARYTNFLSDISIRLDDGRSFETEGIRLADSCYFEVLRQPVLAGNAREILEIDNQCLIPRSLAEKIGGEVTGLRFCSPDVSDDFFITIGGVYEDFPLNSSQPNTIMLSLPTLRFFAFDGRENWIGNDRYISIVRLAEGAKPEDVRPQIEKMLSDNLDKEVLDVFHYDVHLRPFAGIYSGREDVKTMIWVLTLLAVILLMSAGLNYVLVVLGQMVRRNKEMAVRKCYGTSNFRIFARIIGESLFFLLVSMGLAVLLVFCFADQCTRLLGESPAELLSTGRVWLVECLVCLGLLLVTGAIPAWLYCRTPVANAFRNVPHSRKAWKLVLMSVQFFASGLLLCLLVLVGRQYSMLADSDMGFEYENIGYANIASIPQEKRAALVAELERLGSVESVTSTYQEFTSHASGNNVWVGDRYDQNVNVADFYGLNPGTIETMGMRLVQGSDFDAEADTMRAEVIVEERFKDILKDNFGFEGDNIVGQTFSITEHLGLEGVSEFTIRGVVANMRRGGFSNTTADRRAAVMFPSRKIHTNLFVRFSSLSPEALSEAQAVIDSFSPDNEIYIAPYKLTVEQLTESVRRFGSSVIVVCLVIIIIALIGLIGYTADEVLARSKEIAIRKVHGTTAAAIMRLFCKDVFFVALPSLILGGAAAVVLGRKWLSQFTDQVSLSPLSMVLCLVLILALLMAVVALNSRSIARSNPVDYLRNE